MIAVTYVVLCSQRKNNRIAPCLFSALGAYGGVQSYDNRSLTTTVDSPAFHLITTPDVPQTNNAKGVMVFDDHFKAPKSQGFSTGLFSVISSENKKAVALLADTAATVITCGTSSKDTLSLASSNDHMATVSLQRDITDIYGNVLEPMDISIFVREDFQAYPMLCACATLLLSGLDASNGYSF